MNPSDLRWGNENVRLGTLMTPRSARKCWGVESARLGVLVTPMLHAKCRR